MLLGILLPVGLDLLHPRRIRTGVEHCDDDDGRAAANGDFGDVGQRHGAGAPAYYAQQPEQCEEAQYGADDDSGLASQHVSERGRHERRVVARGIGRRPRVATLRRHGEVHGEGVGLGGQAKPREMSSEGRS